MDRRMKLPRKEARIIPQTTNSDQGNRSHAPRGKDSNVSRQRRELGSFNGRLVGKRKEGEMIEAKMTKRDFQHEAIVHHSIVRELGNIKNRVERVYIYM